MTDANLQSLHLEGLPRRDQFRAARARVQVACGEYTLAGEAPTPHPAEYDPLFGPPADGPTAAGPVTPTAYSLKDGDTVYPLVLGINSVGRLTDNSVCVRDEHVSRRHCAVVIHRDGRAEVHDVASKNGTVLNGHKITGPTRLRPGDQLTLCTRRLTFLSAAADAAG